MGTKSISVVRQSSKVTLNISKRLQLKCLEIIVTLYYTPDEAENVSQDPSGSQHQQQRITRALLSSVILTITITWKALF